MVCFEYKCRKSVKLLQGFSFSISLEMLTLVLYIYIKVNWQLLVTFILLQNYFCHQRHTAHSYLYFIQHLWTLLKYLILKYLVAFISSTMES